MKPFFFVHIPKTAGTTFLALVNERVAPEHIFPTRLWPEVTPEMLSKAPQWPIIMGHFRLNAFEIDRFPDHQFITVLRDPMAQVISYFYQAYVTMEQMPEAVAEERKVCLANGLEWTIQNGRISNYVNSSIRFLTSILPKDVYNMQCYLTREHLESAKSNLVRFRVGFIDHFNMFVRHTFADLGLPPAPNIPITNVNTHKPEGITLSRSSYEILREELVLEYELYQWALAHFITTGELAV